LLLPPCIVDGWARREIKKETYGFTSTKRVKMAVVSILGCGLSLPIYFSIPIPVTPLIVPLWMLILGASAITLISNIQKRY